MTKSIRTLARTLTLTVATLLASTTTAAAAQSSVTGAAVETSIEAQAASNSLDGEININTASAAELELLPGIGPSIAKRIVSYRAEHPFKQRNHIMRVKGVGQKTFAKIKDFLIVEGETTLSITK